MNIIEDPEEQCPFDVSHWVAKSKMPYHVTRCLVNHPNTKKKQCRYVAYHYVDPEDFEQHCAECSLNNIPNQWSVATKIDELPLPSASHNPWGIDTQTVTSPLKDIQNKVDEDQPLIGHSKKQRKAHRHEIILRNQRKDNESDSTSGDDATDVNSNGDRYLNSDALDPENIDLSRLTIQDSSKESKSWDAQGYEEPKQYNDFEAIQKEQMRSEKRQTNVKAAPPQNELPTVNLKTVQFEQKNQQRNQNQKPFSYADALKRK